MQEKGSGTYSYLITLISAVLFIPFLGGVHLFDWDEINFAECAREMVVTGDYSRVQLNFQPFWEKPPLFIWLQALCMKIFGVSEFAARLPNAICGIISLNVIYHFGKKIKDRRFALLWVITYAGSFLPFLYFKSGIIDPWFNLFIFLSVMYLVQWFNDNQSARLNKNAIWAGLFGGLAVLTKGPVATIIIGITLMAAWLVLKIKLFAHVKNLLIFMTVFALTGLSWFIFEIATGHADVVKEFINYQVRLLSTEDSDHGGFLLYHFVVLLAGCFPASVFLIAAHKRKTEELPYAAYVKKWMMFLFWIVLILFTIVKTKIVHYSSMCYFPLTYLAALTLYDIVYRGRVFHKALFVLALVLTFVSGLAFTAITLIERFKQPLIDSGLINDSFAIASLQTKVDWVGYECVAGLLFMAGGIYFLVKLYKQRTVASVYGLFITSVIAVWLLTVSVTPKIEQYAQGPAIEFYENLQEQDCYVETIGFKSYAYMFYTRRLPSHNSSLLHAYIKKYEDNYKKQGYYLPFAFNLMSMNFMLDEKLDKPAYFAVKVTQADDIAKRYPALREIYRKGGFAFFKKEPEL